ncbi:unnamed protein product [Eruca vesicaria subsp. sativa]|uniref:Uncharacterized protein n=1 Tax=Eruca vesicaria subsp. sativa TaxID=29727 RepID=A0ABC8JQI8_ERUVS|nr:unnamed protein product [Eruca vesicaria subsp. sativa]
MSEASIFQRSHGEETGSSQEIIIDSSRRRRGGVEERERDDERSSSIENHRGVVEASTRERFHQEKEKVEGLNFVREKERNGRFMNGQHVDIPGPQGPSPAQAGYRNGGPSVRIRRVAVSIDMETEERSNKLMTYLQNATEFGLMAVSLGYYETLMSCSSSSTSSELDPSKKAAAGSSPGLVRISIGYAGTLEQKWTQFKKAFIRMYCLI